MALAVAAVFLDVGHLLPASWTRVVTSLQFGPALLNALTGAGMAIAGLVFVLLLTLLFGRVYCSHLCPLGVLQDIVIWFRQRVMKHRRFPYVAPRFRWHYAITTATIGLALAGSMIAVDLLEPYSNAGRILADLVRPILMLANNAAAMLAGLTDQTWLQLMPIALPHWTTLAGAIAFTGFIAILSYRSGRLFCNLLCPVGGLLSVISHRPAFAIRIRGTECIDCGLCERVCRAQCIDSERRTIDTAACVGCFDCLTACPTHGMDFVWKTGHNEAQKAQEGEGGFAARRRLLTSIGAIGTSALMPLRDEKELQSSYDAAKSRPVVPPGGGSTDRFSNLCTSCHLCVAACPTQVIQPAALEYGWSGLFQPKMDYAVNYCTFDCVACGDICPTGALVPLTLDAKHVLQLGKVVFVKEDCIVETKKKDCGACAEHCPTKAVRMVPFEGKLRIPEVDNQYCVGCGACEHACPTIPRRAIYIDPLNVHAAAKVRPQERNAPVEAMPEEFPF
jgi:ferredoxin